MTDASQPTRRAGLLIAAATAALLVVGAGVAIAVWRARGGDATTSPNPSAPVGPSPTAATRSAEQEAADKVSAAYNGYWQAYVAAAATSDFNNADLPKYLADPLLTEVRFALRQAQQQGIVYKGRPTWNPRAATVNLTAQPNSATIEDCFDSTGWDAVYQATGKSAAAPGQAKRYVITSTAKLYSGRGWLIAESRADRSRTC